MASLGAVVLSASPAAARDLNCFEWVAAKTSTILHHRPQATHAAIHRPPGVPRAHVRRVHHVARPARPRATPVHMIRKPIACPEHEVALQSLMPGAAPPESPQLLLAELAGPPPLDQAAPAAIAAPATAPVIDLPPEEAPFFTGGTPGGGVPGFPSVLVPGGPLTPPPVVGPPVVGPPVVGPPVVGPPDTGTPPVVTPPDTPPVIGVPGTPTPPDVFPPDTGPPPGPPGPPGGGVPEPDAWALMIVGFGAVGAVLRRRGLMTRA